MEPMGFWEWFGLFLLFFIPIVNIIVFIVGACGVGKLGFVNYCRAALLWMLIGVGIVLLYGWLSGGDFPGIPDSDNLNSGINIPIEVTSSSLNTTNFDRTLF